MNSSHAFSHSRTIAPYFLPQRSVSSSNAGPGRRGIRRRVNGLHIAFEGIPVLLRGQAEGIADRKDDAGLNGRQRPHVGDDFGQALEPVADQKECVLHTAVLDVGEDAHPELRSFPAGAGPQAQDVLLPVQDPADRGVNGAVGDLPVADLDYDGLDEDRGIDLIQRPALPPGHFLEDLVRDRS